MTFRETKFTPQGGIYKLNYLPFTIGRPAYRQIKYSSAAHLGTESTMQLLLTHLHFCSFRFPADLYIIYTWPPDLIPSMANTPALSVPGISTVLLPKANYSQSNFFSNSLDWNSCPHQVEICWFDSTTFCVFTAKAFLYQDGITRRDLSSSLSDLLFLSFMLRCSVFSQSSFLQASQ